ncbi:MAG TPA: F0F1 ATP synthase subunit B [Actinomycetota bacterium]|nr:F0F1 ATP synthase subunit B [Actinomycetota bacterium]
MHLAYLLAQEAAQEESRNPILPAWNELIWGAVAFFLLLFLMYRTVWPQVNKLYQERQANIQGKLEQAEKERADAEQLLEKYRERLAAAEDETQRILEEARANAERVRKDLLAKADADAERQLERARQAIRSERDQAIRQLRTEVGTLAVELATRVVGDSLDRDRQLRLVDQYIDQLGDQTQAGALTSRREDGNGGTG